MGGRHTEREYPESNISMQEAMFLILNARDYQDAQELTVRLQNRLKEIIEKEEGCRVMGIGLEGGLAPYIEKGDLPASRGSPVVDDEAGDRRVRLSARRRCRDRPRSGDERARKRLPSRVRHARQRRHVSLLAGQGEGRSSTGTPSWTSMSRRSRSMRSRCCRSRTASPKTTTKAGGCCSSVWATAFSSSVTTWSPPTIRLSRPPPTQGLINAALIKANQIGSLYETLLAMLVALGKGMDLVVSHRSKSPNDDMEAQIALSVNALGLKAGGGANTERLVKYQAVTELMLKVAESGGGNALRDGEKAVVRKLRAYEEPTNAGIPTVGVTLELAIPTTGVLLKFKGATPLGTSAGTGEAIHLVDSVIERTEYRELVTRFPEFFEEVEPGVLAISQGTDEARVLSTQDEGLISLFERTQRYRGKGCLNAVENVLQIIAPHFEQLDVAEFSLKDIDTALLGLELATARHRGKIGDQSDAADSVRVMQRKQNLGMNAMLSASLALARALAHVQGKELYELLREEMLAIIDDLAAAFQIEVHGSCFNDYVIALREVNHIVEGQGRQLYEVLRDQTGFYSTAEYLSGAQGVPRLEEAADLPADTPHETHEAISSPKSPEPQAQPAVKGIEATLPEKFTTAEQENLAALSHQLYRAYVDQDSRIDLKEMLSSYQQMRSDLTHRLGRFGIVNNRIFKHDGCLRVPYLLGETLVLHAVRGDATEVVSVRRFPTGIPGVLSSLTSPSGSRARLSGS